MRKMEAVSLPDLVRMADRLGDVPPAALIGRAGTDMGLRS
jgi:hypothetical protein